jgi:hypothetical protein
MSTQRDKQSEPALAPGGLTVDEYLEFLDQRVESLEAEGKPFDAGTLKVFRDSYAFFAE